MRKVYYKAALLMFGLVILFFFRNETGFLETIGNYASVLILLLFGILMIISKGFSNNFVGGIKKIYTFWWILFMWLILLPFIFDRGDNVSFMINEGLYHDYRYLSFFSLSFLFISDKSAYYRTLLFKNIGYIGLAAGFIAVLLVDKSISSISSRENGYTLPYYLWWIVMWVYPYLFLRYLIIGKSWLWLVLFCLHLLLSLLFLKRAGVVDAGLIIVFFVIFSRSYTKKLKSFIVASILLLVGFVIFGDYTDILSNRFQNDSDNIEEWDRNLEILEFYKASTELDRGIGYGANNYLKMYYIGDRDRPVNALHIGFYNIMYKGGYLYVGFFLFLIYEILSLYKYIHFDQEIRIGFILGLVFILGHAYQFSWSYNPLHFFWLTPIFRAIYLKSKLASGIASIHNYNFGH